MTGFVSKYFPMCAAGGWTVVMACLLLVNMCLGITSLQTAVIYIVLFLTGLFFILYFIRHLYGIEARNNELQKNNTEKDRFFSIIAHDLKTPAANIQSLTEALKMQYTTLSQQEQECYIDILYESAKTHNNLLNTLLDLSRLRSGSKQYIPVRINVRTLIDEVMEQTKLQAQQKEISQTNQAEECFPIADENMITTVLRNIVVNAIKFTYPGGQITVSARYANNEVVVSVADTGIGIDKSLITRIFDADCSKSTAGTANEPGTGLGLVLCKEYVERNNGRIWVESKIGAGTTFFFTLPAGKK